MSESPEHKKKTKSKSTHDESKKKSHKGDGKEPVKHHHSKRVHKSKSFKDVGENAEQIKNLEAQVSTLNEEHSTAIAAITSKLEDSLREVEVLKQRLESKKADSSSSSENEEVERLKSVLENEKNQHSSEVEGHINTIASLKEEIAILKQENEKFSNAIESQLEKINHLESKSDDLLKENAELSEKARNATNVPRSGSSVTGQPATKKT